MSEIQKLNAPHHKIIELMLAGYGPGEIAQAVGLQSSHVSVITRSPNFQHELARRRESVEKHTDSELASTVSAARVKLDSLASRAVDKLSDMLEDEDHGIQFKATKDILDRVLGDTGGPKTAVFVLGEEALLNLRQAMTETIVDVVPAKSV